MKVAILAGGLDTRLSEETVVKPTRPFVRRLVLATLRKPIGR
jgi:hypothetical protein